MSETKVYGLMIDNLGCKTGVSRQLEIVAVCTRLIQMTIKSDSRDIGNRVKYELLMNTHSPLSPH